MVTAIAATRRTFFGQPFFGRRRPTGTMLCSLAHMETTEPAPADRGDRELVEQARAGSGPAMHELYRAHHRRIYGLTLRLTGNTGDAEDAVQETFLRAWRNLGRFRGESSFGTWLYRIAVNLCRDAARKHRPTETATDGVVAPPERGDVLAREQLQAALARLPRGYREVVVLHDVMELGHADIADLLGIAVGTSKSQLHKARVQLRRSLGGRG